MVPVAERLPVFKSKFKSKNMEHLLTHNNASMKTEVETFFIEETKELMYDNEKLDQWNALVAQLELTGQTQIVKTEKSPIPFLWMNGALVKVFQELCPTKVDVRLYDKTTIPVEALSLVSLSTKEGYFDKIEVWYNDKNPDPAIIGYKFSSEHKDGWSQEFYAKKYLLARWSDVKASLADLTERARKLFIMRRKNEIAQNIKNYQRELEDIELTANREFGFAGTGSGNIDLPF
jgi:hypothetical protein